MSYFATAAISFVAGVALAAWVDAGHVTAAAVTVGRPASVAGSNAEKPA
jgi:hypothetical protein